ncbi:unnamed protein product [Closterium sp. NIES-54]
MFVSVLRYFLARELQQRGQLRLAYVASQANTADVFTKALQPCDHQRFCTVLGLVFVAASRLGPESAPCLCRLLSHQTLLWHHRLGHPSLPRLRGMASHVLVSGLPQSLPPLPPGPAPTVVPCIEGRQRAVPHSSKFPPTQAPLQTLHMDVWGPARVRGQGHERYFLLVVDDYSRYTTVPEVLIDWIRVARLQLRERFGSDFPVLCLHSDRGGEFTSDLLRAFGCAEGIRQTFTLPASLHQNGIAERRIGMVMDVARTSMIHAAAPHFLWLFAVQYAAHQLNLQPRVSIPMTSPTQRWTGKVGDASAFRFYHPTSRRVLSSQDVTFDELGPAPSGVLSLRVRSLEGFDFTYSSPQATPLSTRHSLSALPPNESVEPSGPYPELVGCLMNLMTCTRRDLAYPLSILARYVAPGRHRPEHMAAAKRVLRYLCSTSGMGLVLGGRSPVVLTGHAHASLVDDLATQRSSQGYTFSLGSGSVSWRSTHLSSILSSSYEAEIYARAMAAQELRWLTYLLTDLGEPPRSPRVLYVDNKAMLALCREHRLEHRTKHIALCYFLARELQQRGQLRLAYVASQANTADIFTKALQPCDHQRFCTMLGTFKPIVTITSPTLMMTSLRVKVHVAARRDYELHSLDFSTAFLQGSLHEEIWLRRPPGFTGSFPAGTHWSLWRPVYGLRQAPREWHNTLRTTLAALGFAPSTADPSLFMWTDTSLPPFYVLMYVDDLVFATADTEALVLVKSELQKRHTCTDLAPPSDKSAEPSGPYPELVGYLMFLMTCTRPDLAYPLSILACYDAPGRHRPEHWEATKRVLLYLCSTSGMGLVLGGRGPLVLTGHTDTSWVDDLATQRSSQGYTFSLCYGFVSWRSTRSSSVLSSNCEAEIYAGAMAAQELHWLTHLLTDLGERPRSSPVLYIDNKAMIALCQEHRLEHRTKHIALRYFLARELQQRGQLHLAYVATRANTADIFTNALHSGDHQRFCTVLGLVPSLPHLLTA